MATINSPSDDSLFVLQVVIDSLSLSNQCQTSKENPPAICIAFQLHTFDVVVLDVELPFDPNDSAYDSEIVDFQVRKGKSCMFRMPLSTLIGSMLENPLSLMVLQRPPAETPHRGRLIAFTCIEIPHVIHSYFGRREAISCDCVEKSK
jgi:hypothetical protein